MTAYAAMNAVEFAWDSGKNVVDAVDSAEMAAAHSDVDTAAEDVGVAVVVRVEEKMSVVVVQNLLLLLLLVIAGDGADESETVVEVVVVEVGH
jgi:hypothetical protein